jgi:DNA-directed RNA polymerase subunit omega
MIKDKDEKNLEILQGLKAKILENQESEKPKEKKHNPKYDPKEFNMQTYSYGDYDTGELTFDDEEEADSYQNQNHEGLRYPSIDELLEVVDSKYKLAYISAKRAKIIKSDNYSSVENKCVKPVGKALEEILAGKVTAKFE